MVGNVDRRVHDLRASALGAVRTGRCTSPSFREHPEGLRSLVACLFNRQADVGKEMVFSISQLAERTPLAAAFDPDLDRRRQLCEKERDKARSSQDRCPVVTSRRIGWHCLVLRPSARVSTRPQSREIRVEGIARKASFFYLALVFFIKVLGCFAACHP